MMGDPGPISTFLAEHAPFEALSSEARAHVAGQVEIEYFRRGSAVFGQDAARDRLLIVRSGAIEERSNVGGLIALHHPGDIAGAEQLAAPNDSPSTRLTAAEDTLVYSLTAARFDTLCRTCPAIALFFTARAAGRLRAANEQFTMASDTGRNWTRSVAALTRRSLVRVPGAASIRTAAELMTRERVSSVFIDHGTTLGVVTDRDLRSRVVARGISVEEPVHSIMSTPVLCVDQRATLLDALMTMLDHGVHHLGIKEGDELIAAVTATDVVQSLAANPVILQRDIARQETLQGLIAVSRQRSEVALQLIESGARAEDTHRVLSHLADTLLKRLVDLYREQHAPSLDLSRCAWLSFGSQARQETALGSDQDNGLILTEDVTDVTPYAALATWVCDALAACGYPKCHGGIMASNPKWLQRLSVWKGYFTEWISEPSRDAVMRGSIFFDQRCVAGNTALTKELSHHVAASLKSRPLFIAHMARDALSRTPPLGLFGRLILEQRGEHGQTLDLKHRGVIPIVDLARAYALLCGCEQPNTRQRLEHAAEHGELSVGGRDELTEALEWIARQRLLHHARCIRQHHELDNKLTPEELSSADRRHLRDAFSVIKTFQEAFAHRHQLGALSG